MMEHVGRGDRVVSGNLKSLRIITTHHRWVVVHDVKAVKLTKFSSIVADTSRIACAEQTDASAAVARFKPQLARQLIRQAKIGAGGNLHIAVVAAEVKPRPHFPRSENHIMQRA